MAAFVFTLSDNFNNILILKIHKNWLSQQRKLKQIMEIIPTLVLDIIIKTVLYNLWQIYFQVYECVTEGIYSWKRYYDLSAAYSQFWLLVFHFSHIVWTFFLFLDYTKFLSNTSISASLPSSTNTVLPYPSSTLGLLPNHYSYLTTHIRWNPLAFKCISNSLHISESLSCFLKLECFMGSIVLACINHHYF